MMIPIDLIGDSEPSRFDSYQPVAVRNFLGPQI
jgi:hypothetical protein